MDNTTDIHICNDLGLMIDFIEKPIIVRGSIEDEVLPR